MKKICAWCTKILPDMPGPADAVTVGICDECDARVREEEGLPPAEAEVEESENCSRGTDAPKALCEPPGESEAAMLPRHIQHREPDVEHREPEIKTR